VVCRQELSATPPTHDGRHGIRYRAAGFDVSRAAPSAVVATSCKETEVKSAFNYSRTGMSHLCMTLGPCCSPLPARWHGTGASPREHLPGDEEDRADRRSRLHRQAGIAASCLRMTTTAARILVSRHQARARRVIRSAPKTSWTSSARSGFPPIARSYLRPGRRRQQDRTAEPRRRMRL